MRVTPGVNRSDGRLIGGGYWPADFLLNCYSQRPALCKVLMQAYRPTSSTSILNSSISSKLRYTLAKRM